MVTKYFEILHMQFNANYLRQYFFHFQIWSITIASEQNDTNIIPVHLMVQKIVYYNPYKGPFAVLCIKWKYQCIMQKSLSNLKI